MNYPYEFIQYNASLPIKLFYLQYPLKLSDKHVADDKASVYMPKSQLHWHKEVEILYVVEGVLNVTCGQKEYQLHESDFILFNSNEVHTSYTMDLEKSSFICLQIHEKLFEDYCEDFEHTTFMCNTIVDSIHSNEELDLLRLLMLRMMVAKSDGNDHYELLIRSWLNLLIYQLLSNYVDQNNTLSKKNKAFKNMERLKRIIGYINHNYKNPISLKEIAESENLSFHYLSHFINDSIGLSFQQYLNEVRLEAILDKLTTTEMKVIDIVYECGFSDVNNFYKLFKRHYGMTPINYRKQYSVHSDDMALDLNTILLGVLSEVGRNELLSIKEKIQQKYGWTDLPG